MNIIFCNELIHLLVCIPSNIVYNFKTLQLTAAAVVIFASLYQTLSLGSAVGKCGHPHDGAVRYCATSHDTVPHSSDRESITASPSSSSAECLPLLCCSLILVGSSHGLWIDTSAPPYAFMA
jgi:hypothetical protein